MNFRYQIGDLVHVPQAVTLVDRSLENDQLLIPMRWLQTEAPRLAIVTAPTAGGYVQVYYEGDNWSVKNESVYKV
tara:strand:- start:380 stop:604 length:225 start_codon:yes stop_codon:yes gene_type:complete